MTTSRRLGHPENEVSSTRLSRKEMRKGPQLRRRGERKENKESERKIYREKKKEKEKQNTPFRTSGSRQQIIHLTARQQEEMNNLTKRRNKRLPGFSIDRVKSQDSKEKDTSKKLHKRALFFRLEMSLRSHAVIETHNVGTRRIGKRRTRPLLESERVVLSEG